MAEKCGQVEIGVTPCAVCGQLSEIVYDGNALCMSDYIKRKYQAHPLCVKLANEHAPQEP